MIKRNRIKKWGTILVAVMMLVQSVSMTAWAGEPDDPGSLRERILEAGNWLLSQPQISEWGAIGLAVSGQTLPDKYLQDVKKTLKEADGRFSRVTDYERLALGILAAGENPQSFAGYDLIQPIVNDERLDRQGTNGIAYALILLGDVRFALPEGTYWNEDKLIDWLLSAQNGDGGWALVKGSESTVDITTMSLIALAPFQTREDVKPAVDAGVAYLATQQQPHGGFALDSAEATAQAIIALTSLGIDPLAEPFAAEEGNPLSYLYSLRQSDGGYAHLPGGKSDAMATEQTLMALAAYQQFLIGGSPLYELVRAPQVDIVIEGTAAPVAKGKERGAHALEAVERFLRREGIEYTTQTFSFGTIIDSIDGETNGMFGGFDGWFFVVNRDGEWVHPMVGIDSFELEPGDQVVVFYSDMTLPVKSVEVIPEVPKTGKPFAVKVSTSALDWETGGETVAPAANVRVEIEGLSAVTDEAGLASFPEGLPASRTYDLVITGYRPSAAPIVIRTETSLYVAPASIREFADFADFADWAHEEADRAVQLGIIRGRSQDKPVFKPKQHMTRAEFAALLVQTLKLPPPADRSAPFVDVPAESWFGDEVAALIAAGILPADQDRFRPHDPITREEMAVWTANVFGWTGTPEAARPLDIDLVSDFARDAVIAVYANDLIVGFNQRFRPLEFVPREAAAAVAVRIYDRLEQGGR